MSAPIPLVVTRWQCPHCTRGWSTKKRTAEHMGRCWKNPATRGCKTCQHFESYNMHDDMESCQLGVSLLGSRCEGCGGQGEIPWGPGIKICPLCDGIESRAVIRPGPIVHCDLWEAAA